LSFATKHHNLFAFLQTLDVMGTYTIINIPKLICGNHTEMQSNCGFPYLKNNQPCLKYMTKLQSPLVRDWSPLLKKNMYPCLRATTPILKLIALVHKWPPLSKEHDWTMVTLVQKTNWIVITFVKGITFIIVFKGCFQL